VLVSFATFWLSESPSLCGNVVGFTAWALYTALAMLTGGMHAPVLIWYASIPVLTLLMSGPVAASFWTSVSAFTVVGLFLLEVFHIPVTDELTAAAHDWLRLSAVLGLLVCIYTLVWLLNNVDVRAQRVMREVNQLLEVQATTDGLTGCANRRCFDLVYEVEWKRHERTQLPLSIAMLDIDFFKKFNDALGHLEGDRCLKAVADAIRGAVKRPGDFVARYGGEEFVVVLPNTGEADAARIGDELRREVKALQIPHPDSLANPWVTISVGTATAVPTREGSHLAMLHEADQALYAAKTNGRDLSIHARAGATAGRA
jgi:diguanylate cyclase (GGDEF)-like protein